MPSDVICRFVEVYFVLRELVEKLKRRGGGRKGDHQRGEVSFELPSFRTFCVSSPK